MASGFDVDRVRAGWWLTGALAAGVLLFVLYSFVGTFVLAVFVYYAARPLYRRLRPRLRSKSVAAALSLVLLSLPVVLMLAYTLAVGLSQAAQLLETTDLDQYERLLRPYFEFSILLEDAVGTLRTADLGLVGSIVDGTLVSMGILGSLLVHTFVIFAMGFYLLRDGDQLWAWARDHLTTSSGPLYECCVAIDQDFSAIFFGNILNAIVTGAIGVVVYSLLTWLAPAGTGVPFPVLAGLFAGVASLVPLVGTKLVYVPITAYLAWEGLVDGGFWFTAVFLAVSVVFVDTIPDLVLRPYITGRRLHTGLVMFAYVLGPLMFGWYGLFFGPILLVVIVHFAYYILPALIEGHPI